MEASAFDNYGYLLERMEPIEAISHLIHSRIFEILGYLSIARKEERTEEIDLYISRLEEISEKFITEFHTYLDYYNLGDKNKRIDTKK